MAIAWMVVGSALGALSRLDETDLGRMGISSSTAWLAVAFAVGALAPRAIDAAGGGAVTLTFANLGYYGWAGGAFGRADRWFELGVTGGAVFALLGFGFRSGNLLLRAAAGACLVGVFAFEAAGLRTHALGPGIP